MGIYIGQQRLTYLWGKIKAALGVKEDKATIVNHGTSDTTFALTPNVLHTWGTVNSLTLTLASGSSTYVDGYWFKFTAGSSFTDLTLPSGVNWVTEPEIEVGKTYEVMIVDGLASYVTSGIGDSVKAKTRIVNHGTADTTFTLTPNTLHIWGEVASLNLSLQAESNGYVSGYWFRFTCGSTPTTLTLPSSVEWYYEEVEFEANHTYEVTIVEGKACYTDYTDGTSIATKTWVQSQRYAKDVEIVAASGSTLTCDLNKMYVFSNSVTTLAITLPIIESTNIFAQTISIFLTTGASSSITFSGGSGVTVMYLNDFDLEDNTTYELNVLWNGSMWIVGHSSIVTI